MCDDALVFVVRVDCISASVLNQKKKLPKKEKKRKKEKNKTLRKQAGLRADALCSHFYFDFCCVVQYPCFVRMSQGWYSYRHLLACLQAFPWPNSDRLKPDNTLRSPFSSFLFAHRARMFFCDCTAYFCSLCTDRPTDRTRNRTPSSPCSSFY